MYTCVGLADSAETDTSSIEDSSAVPAGRGCGRGVGAVPRDALVGLLEAVLAALEAAAAVEVAEVGVDDAEEGVGSMTCTNVHVTLRAPRH